jgi:D-sedoheptulose 7-phosphate isomerase
VKAVNAGVVRATLAEAVALHQRAMEDPGPVVDAAAAIASAIAAGGKLLLFGNGGSAADAQHAAAELVGRFQRERARQIEALGRTGDVACGITTSGRSANVVSAIEAAKARGLVTIAITGGDGGPAGRAAAIHVNVPSQATARVQEVHRTLLHVICDLVERECS